MDYQPHEFATIFPLNEGQPLWDLADDIKKHGLRERIMLFQGKILDGRRRYFACHRAGVKPTFVKFKGTEAEALAWVISKNLHRRHLNETERATAAAKAVSMKHGGDRSKSPNGDLISVTQKDAAKTFNVSKRSVERASAVEKNGTQELKAALSDGAVSLTDAAEVAKATAEVQAKAVAEVKAGTARTVKEAVERNGLQEVDEEPTDSVGNKITNKAGLAFSSLDHFKQLDSLAQQLQKGIDELSRMPGGEQLRRFLQPTGSEGKTVNKSEHLNSLKRDLKGTRPHAVCPWCNGSGMAGCKGCNGTAWVTKTTWEGAPDNLKMSLTT